MNHCQRVLRHLSGESVDSLPALPITMMFAADLAGVRYRQYATRHQVLVEAQLRTAETFDLDHVSAISDPGREAADCGALVHIYDDQPPAVEEQAALLEEKARLLTLAMPDPAAGGRMTDRLEAVRLFRQQVGGDRLIEGWVEGPVAEAADLRGLSRLMIDFADDPPFVEDLFAFTTALGLEFARQQIAAGADLIGMGDAAASLVGPSVYRRFVWPYERRLIDGIHALGARVRLHICGNTRRILAEMGQLQCDIVDLDFPSPLDQARQAMGPQQVLLGNIDPIRSLLHGTPTSIVAAMAECHRQAGSRFLVGAGCEIARGTPAENLHALVRYAREHRPEA